VHGGFPVDRIEELAGPDWLPEDESYEAQTVGGLVSEAVGRIPHAGEVVEVGSVRIEVVASSDRRVEQVRIRIVPPEVLGLLAEAEDVKGERNSRSRTNKELEVE